MPAEHSLEQARVREKLPSIWLPRRRDAFRPPAAQPLFLSRCDVPARRGSNQRATDSAQTTLRQSVQAFRGTRR